MNFQLNLGFIHLPFLLPFLLLTLLHSAHSLEIHNFRLNYLFQSKCSHQPNRYPMNGYHFPET
jgi:hypothetical protein